MPSLLKVGFVVLFVGVSLSTLILFTHFLRSDRAPTIPCENQKQSREETPIDFSQHMRRLLRKDYQQQQVLEARAIFRRNRKFPAPPVPISAENPVVIFSWHGPILRHIDYWTNPTWTSLCEVGCRITQDKAELPKAHIIMCHNFIDKTALAVRKPWQAIGLIILEPYDERYPRAQDMSNVDILVSFSKYSEVRTDYSYVFDTEDQSSLAEYLTARQIYGKLPIFKEKQKDAMVVAAISNCDLLEAPFRLQYLKELAKLVPVHSYGKCMPTSVPYFMNRTHKSKIDVQGKYLFAFAWENSVQEDYVTEKFYEAILSDAIPIYFGAPNIEEYMPDPLPGPDGTVINSTKSFIDAFHYPVPADLAKLLYRLAKDETAYLEYFQWRLRPLQPHFGVTYNFLNHGPTSKFCRAAKWYAEHFIAPKLTNYV